MKKFFLMFAIAFAIIGVGLATGTPVAYAFFSDPTAPPEPDPGPYPGDDPTTGYPTPVPGGPVGPGYWYNTNINQAANQTGSWSSIIIWTKVSDWYDSVNNIHYNSKPAPLPGGWTDISGYHAYADLGEWYSCDYGSSGLYGWTLGVGEHGQAGHRWTWMWYWQS